MISVGGGGGKEGGQEGGDPSSEMSRAARTEGTGEAPVGDKGGAPGGEGGKRGGGVGALLGGYGGSDGGLGGGAPGGKGGICGAGICVGDGGVTIRNDRPTSAGPSGTLPHSRGRVPRGAFTQYSPQSGSAQYWILFALEMKTLHARSSTGTSLHFFV